MLVTPPLQTLRSLIELSAGDADKLQLLGEAQGLLSAAPAGAYPVQARLSTAGVPHAVRGLHAPWSGRSGLHCTFTVAGNRPCPGRPRPAGAALAGYDRLEPRGRACPLWPHGRGGTVSALGSGGAAVPCPAGGAVPGARGGCQCGGHCAADCVCNPASVSLLPMWLHVCGQKMILTTAWSVGPCCCMHSVLAQALMQGELARTAAEGQRCGAAAGGVAGHQATATVS